PLGAGSRGCDRVRLVRRGVAIRRRRLDGATRARRRVVERRARDRLWNLVVRPPLTPAQFFGSYRCALCWVLRRLCSARCMARRARAIDTVRREVARSGALDAAVHLPIQARVARPPAVRTSPFGL